MEDLDKFMTFVGASRQLSDQMEYRWQTERTVKIEWIVLLHMEREANSESHLINQYHSVIMKIIKLIT